MELDEHTANFIRDPLNKQDAIMIKSSPISGILRNFLQRIIKNERDFYENSENNNVFCRGKLKALKELYYNIFKEEA